MSCIPDIPEADELLTCLREVLTDPLNLNFIIAVIVISITLFLSLIMMGILYAWVYKVNKKLENLTLNNPADFKIRRAQIRSQDIPPQELPRTQPSGQNPLSRSNNYNSVVDDLSRRSINQPNSQQPRYPNYLNDNSNFAY